MRDGAQTPLGGEEDIDSKEMLARLFDARLTDNPSWLEALKNHRGFRIPGFAERHNQLYSALQKQDPKLNLEQVFLDEASRISAVLGTRSSLGLKAGAFGASQYHNALNNDGGLRLDKAVVTILTFNKLARPLLSSELLFSWHSIVACVFLFERDLGGLIRTAARDFMTHHAVPSGESETEKRDNLERAVSEVVSRIAWAAHQDSRVIMDLAGLSYTDGESKKGNKKRSTASYPTWRAIYKALIQYPSVALEFPDPKVRYIRPRRASDPNIEAVEKERLVELRPIERPPFNWTENDDPVWAHPPNIPTNFEPFGPKPDTRLTDRDEVEASSSAGVGPDNATD